MKLLIQRVNRASVTIENEVVGAIDKGLLVFIGIAPDDTTVEIVPLVKKLQSFYFFEDAQGRFGKTIEECGGSVLLVSQFTLYGRCDKGRKPEFTRAAPADKAKLIYDSFVTTMKATRIPVATGIFGAYMTVALENDGPVTFMVEKMHNKKLLAMKL